MKKIYLLLIQESKDDRFIEAIFDKIERAETYIKREFYAGTIPRNDEEYKKEVKKSIDGDEIKYIGKFIPNYILKEVNVNEELPQAFSFTSKPKDSKKQEENLEKIISEKKKELQKLLDEMHAIYLKAQDLVNPKAEDKKRKPRKMVSKKSDKK